jgi:hypothetical protein
MDFQLGDHVQVTATDHPAFGAFGIVTGYTDIDYIVGGTVRYFFLDIGVDNITVTADQISGALPMSQGFESLMQATDEAAHNLLTYSFFLARELDRELRGKGGYDYEYIHLAPATNEVDGVE